MSNDGKNFVIDQRVPSNAPQNDILQAGMSSGLPEYDLSDGFNNSTGERRDNPAAISNVTPFIDSDANRLLVTRQERLLQLRALNPFVPIMMFPLAAKAAVLLANVAQDIPIPSGAKYMVLRGTADYWVSVNGNAAVPVASIGLTDEGNASFLRPDGVVWYCEELKSISVVAAGAAIVSALFYSQQ
jgi:hypothetical protein